MTNMTSWFDLHSNSLSGSIPSQLGALSKLEYAFLLLHNSLSGSIRSELGALTKTSSSFLLSYNQLCDAIPSEVAALSTQVPSVTWDITSGNDLGTLCCKSSLVHPLVLISLTSLRFAPSFTR